MVTTSETWLGGLNIRTKKITFRGVTMGIHLNGSEMVTQAGNAFITNKHLECRGFVKHMVEERTYIIK